ncbi:DUF4381 domain-containing protein [Aliikangiella sp. IMCC44359]|uniref:DUF4381 domain-containing protein n=1 Tax=Aliikangiella sp. IMCC44359 TaxID=3459125 RepID=UPI00403B32A6
MSQQPNPLDQLKDIHLPQPIEQFQLAPGWWVLIGLTIIVIILLIRRYFKKRQSLRYLKPALNELKIISDAKPDFKSAAQISALMKRVFLIYYPQHEVASLSGENWVNFINQQAEKTLLNEEVIQLFSAVIYKPNQTIEPELWQQVITQSEQAISYIIRKAAKERKV